MEYKVIIEKEIDPKIARNIAMTFTDESLNTIKIVVTQYMAMNLSAALTKALRILSDAETKQKSKPPKKHFPI